MVSGWHGSRREAFVIFGLTEDDIRSMVSLLQRRADWMTHSITAYGEHISKRALKKLEAELHRTLEIISSYH